MAWWFAAPLVVWGAKKIYDAVTDDSNSTPPRRDYEAEAHDRERRERRDLVRRQACLTLYGYLEGHGVTKDTSLEGYVTADELRSGSGRTGLAHECMKRFEQTQAMAELAKEIEAAEATAATIKLAMNCLSRVQAK